MGTIEQSKMKKCDIKKYLNHALDICEDYNYNDSGIQFIWMTPDQLNQFVIYCQNQDK